MSNQTLVTVRRPTFATDGRGGRTYADLSTSVPMKIDELSGDEVMRYAREGQRVTHAAFTPGSPDITNKDRIEWSFTDDNGTTTTRRAEVVAITHQSRSDGTAHHTKIFLFEETR